MAEMMTINPHGDEIWRNKAGYFHRDDGPAIIFRNGTKHWMINGEFHRDDGPAVENFDGGVYWWLENEFYTFEEWLAMAPLSLEEKALLKLRYG